MSQTRQTPLQEKVKETISFLQGLKATKGLSSSTQKEFERLETILVELQEAYEIHCSFYFDQFMTQFENLQQRYRNNVETKNYRWLQTLEGKVEEINKLIPYKSRTVKRATYLGAGVVLGVFVALVTLNLSPFVTASSPLFLAPLSQLVSTTPYVVLALVAPMIALGFICAGIGAALGYGLAVAGATVGEAISSVFNKKPSPQEAVIVAAPAHVPPTATKGIHRGLKIDTGPDRSTSCAPQPAANEHKTVKKPDFDSDFSPIHLHSLLSQAPASSPVLPHFSPKMSPRKT